MVPESLLSKLKFPISAQQDHFYGKSVFADKFGNLQPVNTAHPNIQQEYVRRL